MMMKVVRLAAVNLVIFGFLITLLNFGSLVGLALYDRIRPTGYENAHQLPNYQGIDWAEPHFVEYADIQSSFEAFFGWRHEPFRGQTITIDNRGQRSSFRAPAAPSDRSVAFFGGSTMWGVGADDLGTIPSFYGRLNPNLNVANFGAIGFNAHQELNLLMKELAEGYRPEAVIFYDGVNDALQKCHVDNGDAFGHARETQIRQVLQENQRWSDPPLYFALQPTLKLIEEVRNILFKKSASAPAYDCDQHPEKARAVARSMLVDWQNAREQSEKHGATFLAILQPTAFDSKSKTTHLHLDEVWARQYATIYPLIIQLLDDDFSDLKEIFLDLSTSLNQDEYIFIDWCHLSPNGNEIIAKRIDEAIRQQSGGDPLYEDGKDQVKKSS